MSTFVAQNGTPLELPIDTSRNQNARLLTFVRMMAQAIYLIGVISNEDKPESRQIEIRPIDPLDYYRGYARGLIEQSRQRPAASGPNQLNAE